MKTMTNWLLAGTVAAFCCSSGYAQTIYSNVFNGGAVNINGTSPTVANDFAGGTSSATWNSVIGNNDTSAALADGTIDGTRNSVLLPFTPEAGYLYSLTASVSFAGNPNSWVNLGFTGGDPLNEPAANARFSDSPVNGIDWMIFTPASGGEQWFEGPRGTPAAGLASGNPVNGVGTYTIQLDLDTTGSQWVASAFVDGIQFGTDFTYTSNPTIDGVGYGETTLSAPSNVQWNDLALTAKAAPEPSVLALAGMGLAGLGAFLRRRK